MKGRSMQQEFDVPHKVHGHVICQAKVWDRTIVEHRQQEQ